MSAWFVSELVNQCNRQWQWDERQPHVTARECVTDGKEQREGEQHKSRINPVRHKWAGQNGQSPSSHARIGFRVAMIVDQQHRSSQETNGEAGVDRGRRKFLGA